MMTIEDRLRDALVDETKPSFDPLPIDRVRGRATVRRRRRGALVMVTALVAVIGLGRWVGSVETTTPSPVFATTDDSSADEPDGPGEPAEAGQRAATPGQRDPAEPITSSVLTPITEPVTRALQPGPQSVALGPDGEFVASANQVVFTGQPRTNIILRRDESGEWIPTHTWDIGSFMVNGFRRVGDGWMALLAEPDTSYRGPDTTTYSHGAAAVAFSADFETWQHFEIPLETRERILRARAYLGDVRVQPIVIAGGAVESGRVAVQVAWFLDSDFGDASSGIDVSCGQGRDERGFVRVDCDGSVEVIVDAATLDELGFGDFTEPELYVAEPGGPLTMVADAPRWPIAVASKSFVAVDADESQLLVSDDAVTWRPAADLPRGEEIDEPWYFSRLGGGFGDSVALMTRASTGGLRIAIADLVPGDPLSADVSVRAMPVHAATSSTIGMVDRGPDGWVALLNQRASSPDGIRDGDWSLVRWQYSPFEERFALGSNRTDATYELGARAASVEQGLFGEIRVRIPGTDTVVIDNDYGRSKLFAEMPPERAAVPHRTGASDRAAFEHEGWHVHGDPFQGPLVVTDPAGTELVFDDGYAFTNERTDDGVELQGFRSRSIDPGAPHGLARGTLVVYEAGEPVWSAPFADIVEALTVELPVSESNSGSSAMALPGDAWIVTSKDGRQWHVAWEGRQADLGEFPYLVAGDGEVLISLFRESGLEFVQIELDEVGN